jgi:hypothetical protein
MRFMAKSNGGLRTRMPLAGISGGSRNTNNNDFKTGKGSMGKGPKEYFTRKYSTNIPLAEQVIIGGHSMFLQIIDGKPITTTQIDLTKERGMILKPSQTRGSTSPIIEYEYNDDNEILYFIDRA